MKRIKLGVNIDHVATLRNARGEQWPDPIRAALLAKKAGADSITAHLREDRRHIKDKDMQRLKQECDLPLNMEMALTQEMLAIALKLKPEYICIVPEKREEITTEGGLNVIAAKQDLAFFIKELRGAGLQVSLFIDPDKIQIDAAKALGADAVEIHTGAYCKATGKKQQDELQKISIAAVHAHQVGLKCHAGHGLTYDNVTAIAAIKEIEELNIGHFLIAESVFVGLEEAIRKMRNQIDSI